jgi:hypothetical protein
VLFGFKSGYILQQYVLLIFLSSYPHGNVQPPGSSHERILFQVSGDSFAHFLEEHNLLFNHELPLDSSLISLIDTVTLDMQSSASRYQFSPIPRRATSRHLLLLGLVNRGQGRGPARQSYLRPWPSDNETTIRSLAQDRYNFSNPLCIDRRANRFIIYLGILFCIFNKYLHCDSHSAQLFLVLLLFMLNLIASIPAYGPNLATSFQQIASLAMRTTHGANPKVNLLMAVPMTKTMICLCQFCRYVKA